MGNTLTMPESALAMAYDNRGRMREVRVNNVLQRTYYYNARGERVLRVHPTVSTSTLQFVYDEAGHLLGEYKADGTRNAEYVWMDDTLVASSRVTDHQLSVTAPRQRTLAPPNRPAATPRRVA